MARMNRRLSWGFTPLEARICPSVTAAVVHDSLVVNGKADGAVAIAAVDADTYTVTDNGNLVATLDGVTRGIQVKLTQDSTAGGNQVSIDLNTQTIDHVMAWLGNSTNSFTIADGAAKRLSYHGGSGSDTVQLGADFDLANGGGQYHWFCGGSSIWLGDGANSLSVGGDVQGGLSVRGGGGADSVTVAAAANIEKRLSTWLGDGDNSVTVNGDVGKMLVRGGSGADTVTVSSTATVEEAAVKLGDGTNTLNQNGAIAGVLAYRGGSGNDTVNITAAASVGGNTSLGLGAGNNAVNLAGKIGGDFIVRSANANDQVTIANTAVISGTKDVQPGVTTWPKGSLQGYWGFRGWPWW